VSNADGSSPAFDPDALREKYRMERDKRIRRDGNSQYVEVAGQFADYLRDPYTEPVERPPLVDDVTVALIGGGFAGLITGARLTQAGIDDFRIIEKGGDFGGTWYWNRYPGAQCDVESYVYLPLLEETSYVPSEKYARAPEILEHCRRIAQRFHLYERSCLSTEVTGIAWDGARLRWTIVTNRNDRISARSWSWATVPSIDPSSRGSRASRRSKVTPFTPVDGTTRTQAEIRTEGWTA
jgi:NAD(P)-binding Rossmann-like domain